MSSDALVEAPAPLSYVIEGPEMLRLRKQWEGRKGLVQLYAPIIAAVPAVMLGVIQVQHAHDPQVSFWAALGVFGALLGIFSSVFVRYRKLLRSTHMSIELTTDAIDVTTDGDAVSLRWYAVSEARDLPDAYAIARRDDAAHPIFIPKRVLPPGDTALWSFLERRLTGTMPTIRALGFTAPTRFLNTVDQFLSDRSPSSPASS